MTLFSKLLDCRVLLLKIFRLSWRVERQSQHGLAWLWNKPTSLLWALPTKSTKHTKRHSGCNGKGIFVHELHMTPLREPGLTLHCTWTENSHTPVNKCIPKLLTISDFSSNVPAIKSLVPCLYTIVHKVWEKHSLGTTGYKYTIGNGSIPRLSHRQY